MNITRHNYEEYFILYLDNELSSEDRREIELFVKENPDLGVELDILLQSKLEPDTSVMFAGKEQLMGAAIASSVNQDNYGEWLLSYIDNELTVEERKIADQLMAVNPSIKAALAILQSTKLQPEAILFPDKESLYRSEEKVRVISITWRRIAVAAALLLAVSTTALIFLGNNKNNNEDGSAIAAGKPHSRQDEQGPQKTVPVNPRQEAGSKTEQLAESGKNRIEEEQLNSGNSDSPVAKDNKKQDQVNKADQINSEKKNQEEVMMAGREKKKSNDLPEPVYNPNVNKTIDNPIAGVEIKKESLTIPKEISSPAIVTPASSDALYTANTPVENYDPIDVDQSGRKNKLRGFFRKVTRTFEKNTNIKATDDEDRLLVGGLAIKL